MDLIPSSGSAHSPVLNTRCTLVPGTWRDKASSMVLGLTSVTRWAKGSNMRLPRPGDRPRHGQHARLGRGARHCPLEMPTAIAIDTAIGKVARSSTPPTRSRTRNRRTSRSSTLLRDKVIADTGRRTREMLHRFLRKARRAGSPLRANALVAVPSGATASGRRSIVAALSVRRPRYNVRLIDEPVAAAWPPGDLTGRAPQAVSWSTSAGDHRDRGGGRLAGGPGAVAAQERPATPWTRRSCRRSGTS